MNRISTRRVAAGAAALALLTGGGVLAGCGSDSSSSGAATTAAADSSSLPPNGVEKLSAQEILAASQKAAKAATSVTVKGTITVEGAETSLDLVLGEGKADGTFGAQGITAEIRVVDGKTYLKLSGEDFAKLAGQGEGSQAAEAITALIGNKWIAVPSGESGDDLDGLSQFGDKNALIGEILQPDGGVTVKGTGDVGGTPVVLLDSSDGSGTLAIQTVGEPLPIQIEGSDSAGSGTITFTGWNDPVEVTAPTDVVDLEALASLGGDSN